MTYTLKQTGIGWQLYYTNPKAQPCFKDGLVFCKEVYWNERWKLEVYLEKVNAKS